ncbi:riboflavin biosynthesis protein RibF [Parabacteroides sp. FAFU027]|uniref:riboflavin biosynthesis protein RibF n=1 Tax=Parabacteroides sp. FAFU027 TaxID=2922715 RepID=UPI001FAF2047|nr:riboflavin biosynthesis protein RibF [Parabacteroides sp. FAFU027]
MKIITDKSQLDGRDLAATIGFFDGVHRGHLHLINQVKAVAAQKGLSSAVITFREHPRKVIHTDYLPQLLTTFEERMSLLAESGIDYCIVMDFTFELAQFTAQQFIEVILSKTFSVKALVIGYDHRFGKNRTEGFEDYVRFGKEAGMEVIHADAFLHDKVHISSSAARRALQAGHIREVTMLLDRPYNIEGRVVKGHQLGREIGFPTANLEMLDAEKILPVPGVYAVKVLWRSKEYKGMMNIGVRPTVSNANKQTIEVHIFDFEVNVYGDVLKVFFIDKLRDERKMNGLEDLITQLQMDKEEAMKRL